MEDTFLPQTRTGERPLDEYELTQHYDQWHDDLALATACGATMVRWGIPWYRVNPAPDVWDWQWLDQVASRFTALGLEPIIDLMHYGTPMWLEGEFANPDYPARVADYARRVAERYGDTFRVYTPLNEPLLNAIYCGEFGHWPPHLVGDDGFVTLVSALARGIVLCQQAIEQASPTASFMHVEASFRFVGELADLALSRFLRQRAFLIQDLVTGRVDGTHPLRDFLLTHGMTEDDLAWHEQNTAQPDVMGVNYYPAHSTELLDPSGSLDGGPLQLRPRVNEWTAGLRDVLTLFADRYQRPVFLSETCFTGSEDERILWLDESVECVEALRSEGVPVIGYTWWSLFDMYDWGYRHGDAPLETYRLTMGLWDLIPDHAGVLQRRRNTVADRFQMHAGAHRSPYAKPTAEATTARKEA
ncbi:MAG: beta-glucosidase [Frankiales bacterium]|nr:beta-glucosidase [Frankiales bacterium]